MKERCHDCAYTVGGEQVATDSTETEILHAEVGPQLHWVSDSDREHQGVINQQARDNIAFVAAARNALPALIAEVRELRKRLAEFESVDEFPLELQVNCATFTEAATGAETLQVGKDLFRELRRDKARLDWLEQQKGYVRGTDVKDWYLEAPDEDDWTLRAAIDAAMEAK